MGVIAHAQAKGRMVSESKDLKWQKFEERVSYWYVFLFVYSGLVIGDLLNLMPFEKTEAVS